MGNKILIIDEDDVSIVHLQESLAFRGYEVISCNNGIEGLQIAQREHPALIVLEVDLPGLDGYSICRTLRADGYINPIVFLTSRTSEIDAVIGLELGAQDYIRKPLQTKELLARIELQLKKYNNQIAEKKITIFDLEIDLERRRVKYKGQTKDLTHKEFQLLYALAQCPNKVFSRDELLSNVWGWSQYCETRTVDIHIGYLRKKFEENPRRPRLLQTIRGVGYTLCTEVA